VIKVTIPRRYAKALLAIGKEEQKFIQYNNELQAFSDIFGDSPELLGILTNPLYTLAVRKAVLEAVLNKTQFSPVIKNFITLLMDKNRIRYLRDIAAFHQKLVDELSNICSATIISASELSKGVIGKIKNAIEKMTQKQVRLSVEVDPNLIGGIITKVGDRNFDGSVKTQLLSFKEALKKGE
jgi:F-type H+-transporting ATPase subunit delta